MKVLLVYPQYPDTFWSFKHILNFISKKAIFPPLGLLTVASMLPKDWNLKLIDTNIAKLSDYDIAWADMVFISAMVVQNKSAQGIIKRCKTQGKIVVAGGPSFTTSPEYFKGVDYFVLNEAEITLPLFLNDLAKAKAKHLYTVSIHPDITKTPIPLWRLINLADYQSMAVQYSRGCPFNCEFCDIVIMNGRTPRTKTPKQLIAELQAIYNAGWRDEVFIVDDNFIGNKVNVKKMLPYLINWQKEHHFPFGLLTEASVNLAEDHDLMSKMTAANFNKVFLGIETPSTESLIECGKTQNTKKDLSRVVEIIHQHGMQVMAGFIVGFDNDGEDIFERQIKFIQTAGVVVAMIGLLVALPKTRLWHRLKKENRLLKITSGENTDGSLNFIPKMKKKILLDGYKKIINTIYSPTNYYRRIENFLKSYNPTAKSKISKNNLMIFLRSVWKIGVISQKRLLYWKLVLKTLLTKRKALPAVVEMAIIGEHFEKIANNISRD